MQAVVCDQTHVRNRQGGIVIDHVQIPRPGGAVDLAPDVLHRKREGLRLFVARRVRAHQDHVGHWLDDVQERAQVGAELVHALRLRGVANPIIRTQGDDHIVVLRAYSVAVAEVVARQVVHPIAAGGRAVDRLIGEADRLLDPDRLDAQRFDPGRLTGPALGPDLNGLVPDVAEGVVTDPVVAVGQPILTRRSGKHALGDTIHKQLVI